jgi:hypothetical protein
LEPTGYDPGIEAFHQSSGRIVNKYADFVGGVGLSAKGTGRPSGGKSKPNAKCRSDAVDCSQAAPVDLCCQVLRCLGRQFGPNQTGESNSR